jgi:hypothetical protein
LFLAKFWQFFTCLGSFGQFWADFPTLTMTESMPKLQLKSLKLHNS